MNINYVRPSIQLVDVINGERVMEKLENCARTCYQSENKTHKNTTEQFLKGIIKSGHTSVLEHESITIDLTTSRDVLAELTRHRIGVGYSVESTRYVNYEKGVDFVRPVEYDFEGTGLVVEKEMETRRKIFEEACKTAAYAYAQLIKNGAKPQEARAVLPQALEVNMKVTMNIRAWRHFFELRCAPGAHPNIKEIAIALLMYFRKKMLPLFEDIPYDKAFYEKYHNRVDKIVVSPIDCDCNTTDPTSPVCKYHLPRNPIPTCKKKLYNNKLNDKMKQYEKDIDLSDMKKYDDNINAIKEAVAYMTKKLLEQDEAEYRKKEEEKIKKMTAAMDVDDSEDDELDQLKKIIANAFGGQSDDARKPKVTYLHVNDLEDLNYVIKQLLGDE